MKKTKKITVSAMMVALSVAFMTLGYFVETLDLTVAAFASLVVALIYVEIGSPYTYLVWICTSVLSFIFFPASVLSLEYFLVFGIYPILKGYIERAPRVLWYVFKLIFINVILVLLTLGSELLLGVPLVAIENKIIVALIYLVMNVAFIVYDMFITVMLRVYLFKFRNRIKNLLK
jgi:hypothetical protein